MKQFAVHFKIRKGLGPEYFSHTVFVGLDDIDPETSESEIKSMIISDAECQLRNSDDYPLYGKNWIFESYEQA